MIESNIKVILKCDKDLLWDIITDNTNYSWRSDLSKIEVINEEEFVEYDKGGYETHFKIISKKKLKEYKFEFKNPNINGKWIGVFNEIDKDNIELDFTEMIEVKNFFMKLFAKSYLKKQQERYIKDLKSILENK